MGKRVRERVHTGAVELRWGCSDKTERKHKRLRGEMYGLARVVNQKSIYRVSFEKVLKSFDSDETERSETGAETENGLG
jgi:hypothetical protein